MWSTAKIGPKASSFSCRTTRSALEIVYQMNCRIIQQDLKLLMNFGIPDVTAALLLPQNNLMVQQVDSTASPPVDNLLWSMVLLSEELSFPSWREQSSKMSIALPYRTVVSKIKIKNENNLCALRTCSLTTGLSKDVLYLLVNVSLS
jgi:hypothetical protein